MHDGEQLELPLPHHHRRENMTSMKAATEYPEHVAKT